jgi:hypothetical protein
VTGWVLNPSEMFHDPSTSWFFGVASPDSPLPPGRWTGTAIAASGGPIANTTGGSNAVNGTFLSMTHEVGFLGLNTAVVNAISNATQASDGLYGAPASHFPPPPPASGWGAFWNAVTSFVTNPVGTVLSLASTVWDATIAAYTYLDHLAHEAVAIGAQVLARAAATLVSIGKAVLSALDQLLNYLLQLVTSLLKTITQPISNALKSYVWGVETAVGHAQNDTAANGSLRDGDSRAVWSALSGSVFLLALGLSAAVTIGLTILSSVDIGPSFVVDVIISLLIGSLVGVATQALLSSADSSFSSVTSAAVYSLEAFFNSTVGTQDPITGSMFEPPTGGSNQPAWTTAALLVSTCLEFQLAWPIDLFALLKDTQKTSGLAQALIGGTVSLALDITGVVLFIVGLTEPAPLALLILGLVIGIYSYVGAFGALQDAREAVPQDPGLATLIEFDIVLQTINLASAAYATEQAAQSL